MNKLVVTGVVVAAVALVGGSVLLANMSSNDKDTSTASSSMNASDMPANSSSSSSQSESNTSTAADKVEIKGYAFTPASITVKAGTTVTWTNQDDVRHDVMTDTEGKGPSSELLAKGESYSFTFTEPGTYTYHCSPHPYMKGTVIVE